MSERIRIVMQTENREEERHDEDDQAKRKYRRVEFHMVDLKGEGLVDLNGGEDKETELHRNWLPPLLSRIGGAGAMLASGQSIFIVGGGESIEESLASLKPPPERRHLYYKGCSKINLLNQQQIQMWHPLPYTSSPVCVSLLGKLYNFGKWYISPQVFDPSCVEGCWKDLPLPGHLHHDSKRSIPLVADPSNRRILVHSSSTLYAFYPEDKNDDDDDDEGGKWECLDDAFSSWTDVVTLAADDLLFLHDCYPDSLLVYHLATRKWLDVVWSTPFIGNNLPVTELHFEALFSLPNQFMCFACFTPTNSTVHFFKFRVQRCPCTKSVILTPLSFHSKTLATTRRVLDYLPLCEVLSDDEIEMDLSKFFPKFYTDIFASLCSCVANGLVDPNMLKLVSSCYYRDEDLLIMEKEPVRIFVNDAMGNFGGALLRLIASGVMLDVIANGKVIQASKAVDIAILSQPCALDKIAAPNCKVLVVSGDANTNALIVKRDALRIPTKNITCLTRLEHNRALCSISKRLRVEVTDVKNVIIWGMNSSTRNLDVNHARVKIPGSEKSVREIVNDDAWLDGVAVKSEQQSDPSNTITKDTELLMAACDHIRDWVLGTSKDTWISMGVYSDGSLYNVPVGIFFSFSVTCVGGELCWW